MAYAILGTPKPAFFDSSGSPLVSGTITTQDPTDDSVKASYPTAADADAGTNGTSGDITLDSRGEPTSTQYWGKDGEDYKVIIKDSAGATVYTLTNIRLPNEAGRATVTFTSTDATPTIADSTRFITNGTTTITDFDDGTVGDVIFVKCSATQRIIIDNNGAVVLRGGKDWHMQINDTLTLCMFVDQVWTEISRSEQSRLDGALLDDAALTDTTLADITGLSGFLLAPATYYKVSGYLKTISDGNTQDIKFALQTDQTFQEDHWMFVDTNEDGTTTSDAGVTTTGMIADIVTAKVHGVSINGMILTHATAEATVDFQAAQGTDAGTTTLEKGSWIRFESIIPDS